MFHAKMAKYGPTFTGTVLDLGAGSNSAYQAYIPDTVKIISTDIVPSEGVDRVDLNETLPYANNTMDVVTLFHAIYILEDCSFTLREIYRVLKPGGTLYVSSPFISSEIPEPHDYNRLTNEGLEREFSAAGFNDIEIQRVGGRGSSAVVILHPVFMFNIVRFFVFPLGLLVDFLIKRKDINYPTPHTYFCIVKKT